MKEQSPDEKLRVLLFTRRGLGSLRQGLARGEEPQDKRQQFDLFARRLLEIQEEARGSTKGIWRLRRLDREGRVGQVKQLRDELAGIALADFRETWMRTPGTTDYLLEVMLDTEGALFSFSAPRLDLGGLAEWFADPVRLRVARNLGGVLYLAAGVAVVYFVFAAGVPWLGWVLAPCLAWLFYCRARREASLVRETQRWRESLLLIERCRGEVASGCFEAPELARRLREQEAKGLFVHSTLYTVLRMSAAARGEGNTDAAS